MDTKLLKKAQFDFLAQESQTWAQNELITNEQAANIMNLYEEKQKTSFISVLVTIGSVLVGLGILSFIASNWSVLGSFSKFAVIFAAFVLVNFISYKLKEGYPKTSRSLVYLGVLIYGAAIFLIGQAFNFGGHFTRAFFWWAIGIVPMAVLLKDRVVFIFCAILTLVYINGHYDFGGYSIPWGVFVIAPLLYYFSKYVEYSKPVTFFNNLVVLNLIGYFVDRAGVQSAFTFMIFFAIGLIMYFVPFRLNRDIFRLQGNLLFGVFGLILTIPYAWNSFVEKFFGEKVIWYSVNSTAKWMSIIFAVIFVVFLLLLTRRGNFMSVVVICILIFRFYVDTMYRFMDKSIFFISGGLLLLGLGFFIERTRRKLGGAAHEDYAGEL